MYMIKGQFDGESHEQTQGATPKPYRLLYFKSRTDKGVPLNLRCKAWGQTKFEMGKEYQVPVFIKPYNGKNGPGLDVTLVEGK